MSSQRALCLPAAPSAESILRSRKQELKKDVIQWLEKNNLGWSRDAVDDVGANFIAALTDCLWYIDRHHSSLESRSCHLPVGVQALSRLQQP